MSKLTLSRKGISDVARKQTAPWQFKVSTALTVVVLLLVLGYFYESFLEIRKVKPVSVAIEHISQSSVGQSSD
jgi:hypothetical protein